MSNLRVLVTGGRDFENDVQVYMVLGMLHRTRGIACIIHGDATGADTFAGRWARRHGVEEQTFPAEWRVNGLVDKMAGFRRNARMLQVGRPELVIAFSGGNGTRNMVELALAAKVPVHIVSDCPDGCSHWHERKP